jgi:3-hydroxyacyl-[acyl-carrier-protein] dehydratase
MLLGDFYKITDAAEDGQNLKVRVSFNPAHRIFKGHFPELPVVPGVCQLQMLTEVMSHVMKREIELVRASHVKFLKLLNPTEFPDLILEISYTGQPGEDLVVQSTYSWGENIFFRFKGEVK